MRYLVRFQYFNSRIVVIFVRLLILLLLLINWLWTLRILRYYWRKSTDDIPWQSLSFLVAEDLCFWIYNVLLVLLYKFLMLLVYYSLHIEFIIWLIEFSVSFAIIVRSFIESCRWRRGTHRRRGVFPGLIQSIPYSFVLEIVKIVSKISRARFSQFLRACKHLFVEIIIWLIESTSSGIFLFLFKTWDSMLLVLIWLIWIFK